MDERAQSIGISRYFLGIVVGAVLFWILSFVALRLLDRSATSTNAEYANQGTEWIRQAVLYWPYFVLLVSFFGLIVFAIYVREVRR